jgi:X-X-X-Leu-X-X-Gly heptad repeat protein
VQSLDSGLQTVHFAVQTIHFAAQMVHSAAQTVHSGVQTVHSGVQAVHSGVHRPFCAEKPQSSPETAYLPSLSPQNQPRARKYSYQGNSSMLESAAIKGFQLLPPA